MSGCLYQLQTKALPGEVMIIAGPYDTYGQVIALRENGFHLIRGIGHKKPLNRIIK